MLSLLCCFPFRFFSPTRVQKEGAVDPNTVLSPNFAKIKGISSVSCAAYWWSLKTLYLGILALPRHKHSPESGLCSVVVPSCSQCVVPMCHSGCPKPGSSWGTSAELCSDQLTRLVLVPLMLLREQCVSELSTKYCAGSPAYALLSSPARDLWIAVLCPCRSRELLPSVLEVVP